MEQFVFERFTRIRNPVRARPAWLTRNRSAKMMIIRHSAGLYFAMAAIFGVGVCGVLVGGVFAGMMGEIGLAIAALAIAVHGSFVVVGCVKRGRALKFRCDPAR